MIHTYVPYAPEDRKGDLGWTYNNFMNYLNDDDWACFLDHDACFLTKDWYPRLNKIIELNPTVGLFYPFTNRIAQPLQIPKNINVNSHDIKYHRQIADKIAAKGGYTVQIVPGDTNRYLLSGVVMLISKSVWKKVGGFKSGFYGVDNNIHIACNSNNIPVGLMNGIYVYHWYRGDGYKYPGAVANLDFDQ